MRARSAVGAGVPFVFDAFTFLGPGSDFEEDHHPVIPRRGELPVDGAVIGFP